MKKTLVPAAVLALFVMTSPVAWAQETGPDTEACQAATQLVETALAERDAAKVPSQQEQDVTDAQAVLNGATAAALQVEGLNEGNLTQAERDRLADVPDDSPYEDSITERLEALDAVLSARHALKAQQDELNELQATLAEKQEALDGAEEERDGSCAPPTTENPVPPVEDDDEPGLNPEYDCRDFPLTDGTTAQDILNGDRTDPHKLDLDSDGIACETSENHAGRDSDGDGVIDNRGVVEEDSLDDTSTGGLTENVTVPSGGVATGGGPA